MGDDRLVATATVIDRWIDPKSYIAVKMLFTHSAVQKELSQISNLR